MKNLFLFFLLLLSFQASAVNYYWKNQNGTSTSSSPGPVCDYEVANYSTETGKTLDSLTFVSVTRYDCRIDYTSSGGGTFLRGIFRIGDSCPIDKIYNESTGLCDNPPPPPCTNGMTRGSSGECDQPPVCGPDQTPLVQMIETGLKGSCQDDLIAPPTGSCITYAELQSAACQKQVQDCTATGGTHGSIGSGSDAVNICVPAAEQIPQCESGSSQFIQNPDGSSSPTCVGSPNIAGSPVSDMISSGENTSTTDANQNAADTANNTAAIAKTNNEGFQAVVNAINNQTSVISQTGGGTGSAPSDSQPEDPAGPCDPQAANYSECIGQTESFDSSNIDSLKTTNTASGDAAISDASTTALDMINNSSTQSVPSPSAFEAAFLALFPSTGGCSDLNTTIGPVVFKVGCAETELYRLWAAWALSIFTLWAIFDTMFRGIKQ